MVFYLRDYQFFNDFWQRGYVRYRSLVFQLFRIQIGFLYERLNPRNFQKTPLLNEMLVIFVNTGLKELMHFLGICIGIISSIHVAPESLTTTLHICSSVTGWNRSKTKSMILSVSVTENCGLSCDSDSSPFLISAILSRNNSQKFCAISWFEGQVGKTTDLRCKTLSTTLKMVCWSPPHWTIFCRCNFHSAWSIRSPTRFLASLYICWCTTSPVIFHNRSIRLLSRFAAWIAWLCHGTVARWTKVLVFFGENHNHWRCDTFW